MKSDETRNEIQVECNWSGGEVGDCGKADAATFGETLNPAGEIPWTEEPGGLLQSMGLQRVRHD